MLEGENIYVFDIEVKRSPDSCITCDQLLEDCRSVGHQFEKIGWERKAALGISIGCAFSYKTMQLEWFDEFTLEDLMGKWVYEAPLLVGFNSKSFDMTLMRGILRQRAESFIAETRPGQMMQPGYERAEAANLSILCDAFKTLCGSSRSYDLLAEIWKLRPDDKFKRGLNSLDAISQANGLGAKEMDGALAPRLWAQGRYAEVIGYCAGDVRKTRGLFEMVCAGRPILRGDGLPLVLPLPEVLQGMTL